MSVWNIEMQNIRMGKMQESCGVKYGKLQNFKAQKLKVQIVWIIRKYETFANTNETPFLQFTLVKLDSRAKT